MAKYDGFTIKNCMGKKPWLIAGYFHQEKSEVIDDFEETTNMSWPKKRRVGDFKIVKVKLIEAEE